MRGAGNVVEEERLAGIRLVDAVQPVNGVVGHGGDEVPGSRRLAREGYRSGWCSGRGSAATGRRHRPRTRRSNRSPARGPFSKGPTWPAQAGTLWSLPNQEVAKPFSLIRATDSGLVLGDDAVVTREAGGLLGDDAEAGRVMIAPGNQGGARRRAERRGVDVIVAQPGFGDASMAGVGMTPPKRAGHAESRVVGHDEQDVRRFFRVARRVAPTAGLRSEGVVLDHAAEFRVRRRELVALDRRGRVR